MKLLFFSDVHGSPESLDLLLRQAERLEPDQLILLGDVLYHGPRNPLKTDYAPRKVAEMLNARRDPDHCRSRQLRFGGGSDASRISAHGGLFHCFCRRASLLPDARASLESGKAAAGSAGFCFCIRAYPSSGSAEGKVRADSIQSRLHIASERRKSSVVRLLQRSCSPDSESGKRGRNGESFSLKTENGSGRDHPPFTGG